jgi:hypothetical protein
VWGSTQKEQQQQEPQFPLAARWAAEKQSVPAPVQPQQSGQSVCTQNVNSQTLDNMLRVVTVVQQIMTEFNGAVSEQEKIVAITKIFLNLMKHNGH